jgi:signal transduction histidine kinase
MGTNNRRREAMSSSAIAHAGRTADPSATTVLASGENDPILVVDDERTILHVIRSVLESHGRRVIVATTAEEAFQHLATTRVAVALIDIVLPKMSGLQLLGEARRIAPGTEIVLMTSHASLESAMEAIHLGAYDFIQKPFDDVESVWLTVKRALDHRSLALRNEVLLQDLQGKNGLLAAAVSRLSTLIDTGLAMGDFHSTRELLDFVLGLVVREFDAERASVMLVDADAKVLRIAAAHGITGVDTSTIEVEVGEGISGRVAATGDPILVRDISADPALAARSNPQLSDSFMCAPIALSLPIRTRESVLGVLNVTDRADGREFDDDDLEYLASLNCLLAVAIERTRFVEELQRAYETLKTTQAELLFSERVKAIGEIAAGVAHDYNNTLGAILARVQLALHRLERPDADFSLAVGDLRIAEKAATQSASTIKRIQDFARRRSGTIQALLSLNDVVNNAVEMTRPKWKDECESAGRRISVEADLGIVPEIRGDMSDLTQALSNLLLNAVDAMPHGGTVRVRTFSDEGHTVVEVADDGEGIPEALQERIFHPFFTTKSDGHGLGLSIVENIVARHGGDIGLSSASGAGATFRLRFPVEAVANERTAPPPSALREVHRRSARILLVDDLDEVRGSCREMLTAGGHVVTEAALGRDAIAMMHPGRFDLIVTDLGMPDVSGFDVAKEAKRATPDVPVILLSGWAVDQDEARVKESGIDRVLPKPCGMNDLLNAVDATLRHDAAWPKASH